MQQRSLKIGIIVPQFPSYSETFFISQVLGLCKRGHFVYVFSSSVNKDSKLQKSLDLNKHDNLKIISLHFDPFNIYTISKILLNSIYLINEMKFRKGSLKNFFFISLCKIYLGRYKCDVYHFGYSGIAAFYLPVIQALNRRIIISCRGTAENVKPLSETGRISKLRTLFEEADKIHCVSASMVNTIQQYNAPVSKIFINRPAVDIKFFSRKSDYLPSKKIRILSVGRLVFQKGFMIGLLAMVELNKMFCNFEWVIMGDGPEDEELFFNIHLMGLEDKIKLAGKKTKDEVLEGYESTDIFFLPSVSEGIANVVIEAMAMELPVVSSSCGGLKELITGDTNGLLCNNYDYKAMAKALYDLSTNFEKRKTLGKAARKTVEEDFSLERYIDVFEQHYYQLLN